MNIEEACERVESKPRLNLPKAGDTRAWNELDEVLSEALSTLPNYKDPAIEIERRETFIYNFMKERFGVKQIRIPSNQKKAHKTRQQRRLRRLKKDLKRKIKQAIRDSRPEQEVGKMKQEFMKMIRLHNKVRKLDLKHKEKNEYEESQKRFKENPHKYAKNLLDNQTRQGEPEFSKETADKFFKMTYRDNKRQHRYNPLKGMPKPKPPEQNINCKPPSCAELEDLVRYKRNKSAPGTNAIPYLVYKKCPRVLAHIHPIFKRIWKNKKIPLSWRVGEAVLIPKDEDRTKPELFRNITLTNVSGKMFFQVLANRLLTYMVGNGYLDQSIQKGFLPGVAGCVEHTQVLMETLLDSKRNAKDIVVAWLDLANAYGSVAHNLIQFALEWYHVPANIRELIYNYYDELFVRIRTKQWTSEWFMYQIGLFQGCPLSVVLFLMVFNLLLDLLKTKEHLGYQLKNTKIKQVQKAYADDLTLIAKSDSGSEELLRLVETFLIWTRTMRAKPSKCRSLAMKKTQLENAQGKITRPYLPYDPKLKIDGKEIPFIHQASMRFLGIEIYKDLNDKEVRKMVSVKFEDLMERTNNDKVNNIGKLWIYENQVVSRITWEFIIYCFPITFAESLQNIANRFLKKWTGLARCANPSILYRRRDKKGLQLKALTSHLKCMQLIKYHILKYAVDRDTQYVYGHMLGRLGEKKNWNGVKELEERERHLVFKDLCRGGQIGRQGVGFSKGEKRLGEMSKKEHRKALTTLVKEVTEEQMLVNLYSMAQQGRWLGWETAMQLDTTWNKLLYAWSPELLKFYMNSVQDTLPSPANLKTWSKHSMGLCPLCGYNNCTMIHIFNCCQYSLRTGRYNWRHDMVLRKIIHHITPAILRARAFTEERADRCQKEGIAFKSDKGIAYKNTKWTSDEKNDRIPKCQDWEVVWDEDKSPAMFPPVIVTTAKRPDITIYSTEEKRCLVIELTVPAEENLAQANSRKKCKYTDLIQECKDAGWETKYFPVEVGSRGFSNQTLRSCFKYLGLANKDIRIAIDDVSKTALRATYTLWLARYNKMFGSWELVQRPEVPTAMQLESEGPRGQSA